MSMVLVKVLLSAYWTSGWEAKHSYPIIYSVAIYLPQTMHTKDFTLRGHLAPVDGRQVCLPYSFDSERRHPVAALRIKCF